MSIVKCPSVSLFMAFVLKSIYSDISIATLAFIFPVLHFLTLHFQCLYVFCSAVGLF